MGLQLGWWSDQREAKALVGVVQILQPSAQFYQWVAGSHKTHWTRLVTDSPFSVNSGAVAEAQTWGGAVNVWAPDFLANKLHVKYRQCVFCTNQVWMIMWDWDRDKGVHQMFGGSAMKKLVLHSTTSKQCFPLVVLSHLAGASKTSLPLLKLGNASKETL